MTNEGTRPFRPAPAGGAGLNYATTTTEASCRIVTPSHFPPDSTTAPWKRPQVSSRRGRALGASLINSVLPMASSSLRPSYLLTGGRLLLSVHFISELYDKLTRFEYWVEICRAAGQPFPVAEMALVTALLLFGAPCLLLGARVPHLPVSFMPPLKKGFSPSCRHLSACAMKASCLRWCVLSTRSAQPFEGSNVCTAWCDEVKKERFACV